MAKDIQESASKAKEDIKDAASNIKDAAKKAKNEFSPSDLNTRTSRNNMILWGMAGGVIGGVANLVLLKNVSALARVC